MHMYSPIAEPANAKFLLRGLLAEYEHGSAELKVDPAA